MHRSLRRAIVDREADLRPPRGRRWPLIVLAAVCVLLLAAVTGLLIAGHDGAASDPVAAASGEPDAVDTSAAGEPATADPTPTVKLLTQSGDGMGQTKQFTTQSVWNVTYTYDCGGDKGNFAVISYDPTGAEEGVIVNQLQASGQASAIVNADPGTHYLSINSECTWTITVIG